MVIVAIPSMGDGGLNEEMSTRFGRSPSFTIVEVENNEIKAVSVVKNYGFDSKGSAGLKAVQIIGENYANVVIVSLLGPNAVNELKALNLKILHVSDKKITIKEVINDFIQGKLKEISSSNISPHYEGN